MTATTVTALLFEAYLACPTKCFLLSTYEPASNNTVAEWTARRALSYRDVGAKNLAMRHDPKEIISDAPFHPSWVSRKLRLAGNVTARVPRLATVFHAVQRVDEKRGDKAAAAPIPVRFVANNKLTRSDRLILAFDAYVLAKLLNSPVAFGRIVHGEANTTQKIRPSELEREVRNLIVKVSTTISVTEPPKLTLNRHCLECVFQQRCRKVAVKRTT